jgi:NAD(P)-dependent dehydrogenase (short-subunit alcohol dehydrogenase family)
VPLALITGAAGGIGGALVAGFRAAGYDVIAVDRVEGDGVSTLDVTDTAAVSAFAARFDRLAVLINGAGVVRRSEEYNPAVFADVLAAHAPAYAASKAGVVQLTKSLAIAWAIEGIRVNAIAPGWIETSMTAAVRADDTRNRAILERTPVGRWGTPEEVVGPALFLASGAARFVTGAVLPVDGGYSAM